MSLCSTLGFATPWRCILRHTAIVACFVRRCVGSFSGWLASNSRVLCFTYIVSNCSRFFQDFSMEAVAAIGLATNVLHMAEAAKYITSIVKDIRILASGFTKETIRYQSKQNSFEEPLRASQGRQQLNPNTMTLFSLICYHCVINSMSSTRS